MSSPLDVSVWDGIAEALEYPTLDTVASARRAADALVRRHDTGAAMAAALTALAAYLEQAEHGAAEEWYTVLFDLKPVCSLYVGWHIFQDTYDRGALLAGLAEELKKAGVVYQHDLPDYLPTLLRLVARLEPGEGRSLLVHEVICRGLTALERPAQSLSGPWKEVLLNLGALLRAEVHEPTPLPRNRLEVVSC